MHSLLEAYLEEIAGHLAHLPAVRRADELREMRTHLENAVIVGRELGRTEDEAVRDALAQFGTASDLGENLVWAYRREQAAVRKDFYGVAICAVAVTILTNHLPRSIQSHLLPGPTHSFLQVPFSGLVWSAWVVWLMPMFLLVGGISGLLFPKRAVAGVVAGLTPFLGYFFVVNLADASPMQISHKTDVLLAYSMDIVFIVAAAAAAWAVSRLRMAGQRRRRPAAIK